MVLESNATCLSKQKTDVDLKVLELEKQMKSLADENANLSNILFLKAQEFSIEEKRSIDLRQSTEEDSQEWNRKVS